jgi:hypothetical protein
LGTIVFGFLFSLFWYNKGTKGGGHGTPFPYDGKCRVGTTHHYPLSMRAVPKQSLGGKMAFPSRSLGSRRKDEILCPGAAQNDMFLTGN